ncbi:MAG: hypothetical protein MUO27_12085 [Sedimentisphaerales bacterium]|nr:hypothetical protein [Sedimentisphaerales bacterium]
MDKQEQLISEMTAPDHSRKRLTQVAVLGTLAQVLNMVAAMIALTVTQKYWGDEGVGLYTQLRHFSSLLVPFLILGQNNALTRYVAFAYDDRKRQIELSATCSLVTMLVFGSLGVFSLLNPMMASRWILGSQEFSLIMGPFSLALMGKGMGEVGGAYLRGRFRYITVQYISMIFSGGLSFFLLLIFSGRGITTVLWAIGGSQFAVGAGFSGFYLIRGVLAGGGFLRRFWSYVFTLYGYGLVRLPATGLNLVLVSFASWQLANKSGLENLGFFNTMLASAMALNLVAISMSFTLLPMLSVRLKEKGVDGCSGIAETLLWGGGTLGLFFTVQLVFFGSSFAQILLQRFCEIPLSWGYVYGLVVGLILYNITDRCFNAHSTFPYSIIGLVFGVAGMYGLWSLGAGWNWPVVVKAGCCVALGHGLLGVISSGITMRLYRVGIPAFRQWLGLVFVLFILAGCWAEYNWSESLALIWRAWVRVGFCMLNTLVFGILLLVVRVPWVMHILGRRTRSDL